MDLFDQAFDEEFGSQDVSGLPEGYDIFDSVFDEEFGGIGTDQYPEVGKRFADLVAPSSSIVPFSVIARAVRSGWGKAYEKGWVPLTPERGAGKAVESLKEMVRFPTVGSLAAIESAGKSMQEERRQMNFPELYASLSPVDRSMIGPMISDAELRKGMPLSMDEKREIASTFNEGKTEDYIENAKKAREFIQKKLKTDPAYLKSTGYIEDAIGVGGQVGGAILASVVAGPWAGGTFMGAYIAGATYENLTEQGVEPDRAIKWGIANGIMQAPFEAFGLSKVAKLFKARKALFQAVKDLGFAGLAEWTTEFIQAIPESITDIFAKNPDKTALENWTQVYKDLPKTLKQGMYEGLVVLPWTMFFGAGGIARGVHIDKWEKYAVNYLNDETKAEWERIQKLPESEMSQGDKYQWLQDQANAAKQAEDIEQPTIESPDGEITPEKLKELYAAGEISDADLIKTKETLKDYPEVVAMVDEILAGKPEVGEPAKEDNTTNRLNAIADKIEKGETEWSKEELQDQAIYTDELEKILQERKVEPAKEPEKPIPEKAPTRFEGELDEEQQRREIKRLEKGPSKEEIEARAKETMEAARRRREAEGVAERAEIDDAKKRLDEIKKGNILASQNEINRLEEIAKKRERKAEEPVKPEEGELKEAGRWVEKKISLPQKEITEAVEKVEPVEIKEERIPEKEITPPEKEISLTKEPWKGILYRGSNVTGGRGKSYTISEDYAKGYGKNIRQNKLKPGSKVLVLAEYDEGLKGWTDNEKMDEHRTEGDFAPTYANFDSKKEEELLNKGYDAVVFADEGELEIRILNKESIEKPTEAVIKEEVAEKPKVEEKPEIRFEGWMEGYKELPS